MTPTMSTFSYPYHHKCRLAEWSASLKQTPHAVSRRSFPYSKKATGVPMVFGRMATLSRRSVLPQTLSDVILKIRANWMRVKELRSLTDRRVASVFIPCGVNPGFLIFRIFKKNTFDCDSDDHSVYSNHISFGKTNR